jgi:hypothetical protein
MSEPPVSDKPTRFAFRGGSRKESLPPDKARRQGDITSLAFLHLGGRDGAMAFLNNVDAELEGRPLDIAIASKEGCEMVRQMIMRRSNAARTTNNG